MIALLRAAAVALLFAPGLAAAATVTFVIDDGVESEYPANSFFAVNVTTAQASEDRITEVVLTGPGGGTHTYASFASAPLLSDAGTAIADALAIFGLSPATPVGAATAASIGATTGVTEALTIRRTSDAAILGTYEDYSTLIVTQGFVEANVFQTETTYTSYRLTAAILSPAVVPLPAGGALLAGGLAVLALLRRRSA